MLDDGETRPFAVLVLDVDYRTIVKIVSATTMPAARIPILRISRGNVRA